MPADTLSNDDLTRLYTWVDEIKLSRPKRNIARDFSDGVLVAEVVAYYFPKLVDLHNYAAANAVRQKVYNWNTLNEKVLKKMQYQIPKTDVDAVVQCKPGAIEQVLYTLQLKMAQYRARAKAGWEASASARAGHDGDKVDGSGGTGAGDKQSSENEQALAAREEENQELRETNELLRLKITKLEQLLRLKDAKIQRLAEAAELGTELGSMLP
eukprot:g10298.t1